ncbi:MAG: hypothetical protein ACREOO_10085 [bacterium]
MSGPVVFALISYLGFGFSHTVIPLEAPEGMDHSLFTQVLSDHVKDDFRKNGKSELEFISTYLPEAEARKLIVNAAKLKVKYTDYDWDLNE